MPEANSAPILSNPPSRYARIATAPAQKPKLLDCLREALRSRHYGRRTAQNVHQLLGQNDVKTTMIYTHVLNRGPVGVRSPVDGL